VKLRHLNPSGPKGFGLVNKSIVDTKMCPGPECNRPVSNRGLCATHAVQDRMGKRLAPIRQKNKHGSATDFSTGTKRCLTCDRRKPWAEFNSNPNTADKRASYCRECSNLNKMERLYGVTPEAYELMLTAQGGVCHYCRTPPVEGKRLYVDHDHDCCPGRQSCGKCVKWLLCNNCNRAAGYFKEDPETMRRAADANEAWKSSFRREKVNS
jgi:hypothetical protein